MKKSIKLSVFVLAIIILSALTACGAVGSDGKSSGGSTAAAETVTSVETAFDSQKIRNGSELTVAVSFQPNGYNFRTYIANGKLYYEYYEIEDLADGLTHDLIECHTFDDRETEVLGLTRKKYSGSKL